MNRCFGAILSPLNHQYCRSTTYRFLVSSPFLVRELVALVLVQELELVFLLLAVAVESSGYILLLIYEHSLLQLVDLLTSLVLVLELVALVLVLELVALVLVQELELVFLVLVLELEFLLHHRQDLIH
ncbi:Uncharacterised protein [Streptococcus pneumoniae]|nr:Uncharacterised protein [Streptococcus pneumoniae]